MEKKVSESRIEQVYQVRPEHLNGAGRLFGGRLMEWIDELAGLVVKAILATEAFVKISCSLARVRRKRARYSWGELLSTFRNKVNR